MEIKIKSNMRPTEPADSPIADATNLIAITVDNEGWLFDCIIGLDMHTSER